MHSRNIFFKKNSILTSKPKLKPTTTVVEIETAASSKSPKWPTKAWVMTLVPYIVRRVKIAGPAISHNLLDSLKYLLQKSLESEMPSSLFSSKLTIHDSSFCSFKEPFRNGVLSESAIVEKWLIDKPQGKRRELHLPSSQTKKRERSRSGFWRAVCLYI